MSNTFKGTQGIRTVIERDNWYDVVTENNERIASFDKDDERSKYDAQIDAHALEMLEMLQLLSRQIDFSLFNSSGMSIEEKLNDLITRATTI